MTTHDIKQTCKHDFIDLERLSRLRNHILIVTIFQYLSFDVDLFAVFNVMEW